MRYGITINAGLNERPAKVQLWSLVSFQLDNFKKGQITTADCIVLTST